MVNPFTIGAVKQYQKTVSDEDIAAFETGIVHRVYATFALGRDAEWVCRLFVLEMKEAYEEGIGTFLNIQHKAPAFVGETVTFKATLLSVDKNNVICTFQATVGKRIIAEGTQGQKILAANRIDQVFKSILAHAK